MTTVIYLRLYQHKSYRLYTTLSLNHCHFGMGRFKFSDNRILVNIRLFRGYGMVSKRKNIGFSLIELLIVIVILGLLMSLVAPTMFSKVDSTKIKTAKAQMQMLQTALDTYRLDLGDYPKSINDLIQSDKAGWDGPYLPKRIPLDPWNNAYVYKSPGPDGQLFQLLSLGKDGQPDGEGDAADVIHD
jgi:general secretion pathway protein G